jgi:pyrophosphate--fructose-6-phosphate 1-phosphotransferase
MPVRRAAFLTAGGLAPCLSAAVGGLIEHYSRTAPEVELIGYLDGYAGLLSGRHVAVTPEIRSRAHLFAHLGGSPIGNSRVKLTNAEDLVRRGLVEAGEDPLAVAARRLTADGVDVLHTIGGDDTSLTAADLASHLREHDQELTVVGLPKTIDNDIVPVAQSLGAVTAAEQGALFARNILAEHSSNPRMLIVHEVMGRSCGWLTAATAVEYRRWLAGTEFAGFGDSPRRWDIHAVYVPEIEVDLAAECDRLAGVMDELGCVNIFLSEGAGVETIVAEMTAAGEPPQRDPFGHVKLDTINPGAWYAAKFAERIGAEKKMVQKSGYFSRSAAPSQADLDLIDRCTELAVAAALRGESGLVGLDEDAGGALSVIDFSRIGGGKAFDAHVAWFTEMLDEIGQPVGRSASG